MYLLIDRYHGTVYKLDKLSITLEESVEDGDITILDIGECNNPKVLVSEKKFIDVELHQ